MKQGAYWTDPANQVVWGWVERYHVGIGGWGDNMRVRVEDRKEAWELVPERTCTILWRDNFAECEAGQGERWPECSECGEELPYGYAMAVIANYCPECGAKVVKQ